VVADLRRVAVVGAGHVGLVSAACMADRGIGVILVESDRGRLQLLRKGRSPLYEPGLDDLLKRAASSGRLGFFPNVKNALDGSEIIFVNVGTPAKPNGSIDLTQVEAASVDIGRALKRIESYILVVVRSTVLPGTTRDFVGSILSRYSGKRVGEDYGLAMQPEFIREGSAVRDMLSPDRVVIGEYDERSGNVLESFWREFYGDTAPQILRMNTASAEMVKYASNAFLASKISFINQIANICEKVTGVDIVRVEDAMGLDERIGRKFLNAGAGFGGSCFRKDMNALIAFSNQLGYKPNLLKAVLNVNERQALHIVELARQQLGGFHKKRVAILGLSFKPDTDDVRDAPSLRIVERLLKEGASVAVYDPVAMKNIRGIFGKRIDYASSAKNCLLRADCCIIVTEWDDFRRLTPNDFIENMRRPVLIDGRNIYDPVEFGRSLKYVGVGQGPSK